MNRRLEAIMAHIPQNGRGVIDVGTDHGYLPAALFQRGYSGRLIAADINAEPLSKAKRTAESIGAEDVISLRLCDGLDGCDSSEVDTIVIAGMGGDTICGILDRAEWCMAREYTLILQPMTHPEILRKWLLDNGFSILGELLSAEEHRIYQTEQADLHRALICKTRHTLTARRDARAGSGHTTAGEDALLTALAAQEARIARQIR